MVFRRSLSIERPEQLRHVRFFHQALFCLNLTAFFAWLFLVREASARVSWLDCLGYAVVRYCHGCLHTWAGFRHERLFPMIFFLVLWILLASFCCLLTSVLLRVPGQKHFLLRSLPGFVAVCSAPAFWCYFGGWSFVTLWKVIAAAEVLASVLLAFLFLTVGSRFPGWLMVLLLATHCAFWCWYFLNCFMITIPLAQPVVAFASGLAWICYLSDERPATELGARG